MRTREEIFGAEAPNLYEAVVGSLEVLLDIRDVLKSLLDLAQKQEEK